MDKLQEEIKLILEDTTITGYFTSHNRNIYDFVKTYIEVDKVLSNSTSSPNVIYNHLDTIKAQLSQQTSQLQHLSTYVSNTHSNLNSLIHTKLDQLANIVKDTTNTDMRQMLLDLQQNLSNGNDLQSMRTLLENFKDKIENVNTQKLNDFDRKTIEVLSSLQSSLLQSLDSHTISHKINSIEDTLNSINTNFTSTSSKKGQLAEAILLNVLTETFPECEVIDTSHTANSGDMQIVRENKPTILVDSKNFGSKTVPKRDIDKFYSDVQQNNCSGILCNAFGGIANKLHFEIDIVDKNVLVFVHSHQYDPNVFRLASNIIYNVHQEIKDKSSDVISIDQRLYQSLKIEYNYFLQSFHHHLDIIKSNVNSLSQLSFTLLENFFKRKATNVELKQFSCHICGTPLKSEKNLKLHLKRQHPTLNTRPVVIS
jgi:hypothetical protein